MDYKHNLVFECGKEKLEMNSRVDIKLIDIKGIEASSYTINTRASEQDGGVVSSIKVEPREIIVIGDIDKNERELENRDKLIRFFDPKQGGTLYITRNNISRKIDYDISSLDFTTNKMADYTNFTITLQCTEDPYFSDSKNSGNYLTLISPQFAFPLAISATKGRPAGYKTFKPYMPLVNDGDKEVGLEMIITAKRGKVDNPKLILNNKKYIKVNKTLEQWDELRINTNPRKKSIILNGTNTIHMIDRNSSFFSIRKGKNILKYECDNGSTNVDINVQFFRKYIGA